MPKNTKEMLNKCQAKVKCKDIILAVNNPRYIQYKTIKAILQINEIACTFCIHKKYRVESKAQELIKLFKLQFKQSIIIIANFHIEIINLMEKLNTNFTLSLQFLYAECTYFFRINSVAFPSCMSQTSLNE